MSKSGIDFEMVLEPVTTDLDEHKDVRYRKIVETYQLLLGSQEALFLKDPELRSQIVDEMLKAGFRGEFKTKGIEILQLHELQIKQMALKKEIAELAKINNQKEKQYKMQAAEQIGRNLGKEQARLIQAVKMKKEREKQNGKS
jgi:hypothetical protein